MAYCKNKPVSDSTRLEYDDFFTSRQLELKQKLNIEDLLIAPVQRLPRYQLLIRDLLKDTRKVNMDTTKIEVSWKVGELLVHCTYTALKIIMPSVGAVM